MDFYKPLHREALFSSEALAECGGYLRGCEQRPKQEHAEGDLPVTEQLCDRLLRVKALTNVSEAFVRQCGRALRKVAENACQITDLRMGRSNGA